MHSVVLPPPEGPTRATFSPGAMCREKSERIFLSVPLYENVTRLNSISPLTFSMGFASGLSFMSLTASIISVKRSMPVMPRLNCSLNSTIVRIAESRVLTMSRLAEKSPTVVLPFIMNAAPMPTIAIYISPSQSRTVQ